MLGVVIPYYKLSFFEATLKSLANQTDKRFIVYIGDDASPENPQDLLEKYKKKFEFVYHRFVDNLGGISLTKQWDRCIQLSRDEEWLMILGDDDVLGENVVEAFHNNLPEVEKKEINVVRFATQIIKEPLGSFSKSFLHPQFETAGDSWYRKFKGNTRSSMSEHVFLRKSYSKFGFVDFPLAWHSDDKVWLDFCEDKMIYSINESIIYVRVSDISISGRNDNQNFKDIATMQFFEKIIESNLQLFSKKQRIELLYRYELVIKKVRKINTKEWFTLGLLYFRNFNFLVFLKFIRRLLKSIFNL